MFYLFDQNNSGGSFIVNDKVCHRLFIEADCGGDALEIAESLGCYWDGVSKGIDCPCCGDRWSSYYDEIDIEKFNSDGYKVYSYDFHGRDAVIDEWNRKYGKYTIIKQPEFETPSYSSTRQYVGTIAFKNIEEYAQYLANEYGWTTPDARIYYKNGKIKEIFSEK